MFLNIARVLSFRSSRALQTYTLEDFGDVIQFVSQDVIGGNTNELQKNLSYRIAECQIEYFSIFSKNKLKHQLNISCFTKCSCEAFIIFALHNLLLTLLLLLRSLIYNYTTELLIMHSGFEYIILLNSFCYVIIPVATTYTGT